MKQLVKVLLVVDPPVEYEDLFELSGPGSVGADGGIYIVECRWLFG